MAVAVSGGKDSSALLYILDHLSNYSHLKFTLSAIHIEMGWENFSLAPLKEFCALHKIPFISETTQTVARIMPEGQLLANPCALCSRIRRGALVSSAIKIGANKIALGHHRDDFVETAFLNLLHGGKFHAFPPLTHYAKQDLHIIRPFVYLDEATIKAICRKFDLPIIPNPCPYESTSKRQGTKVLLEQMRVTSPNLNALVIHSLESLTQEDLWLSLN